MSRFSQDVTAETFEAEVIEASRRALVLVDFWAEWCGPCRSLKPLLERVVDGYAGRVRLAKVNSDQDQALAARYQVRGIPNVKAFVGGEMVDEFTGALPESALREFISRWLPSPMQERLDQARSARAAGDAETAERLLREAIDGDGGLEAAEFELVDLLIDSGRSDEAGVQLGALQHRVRDQDRLRTLQARLALTTGTSNAPDVPALRARIQADPDDLAARLALGRRLAADQAWEPALEMLLEVVRRNRDFQDDVGRRTMLDVFNLMPPADPALRTYRGLLARAIHR